MTFFSKVSSGGIYVLLSSGVRYHIAMKPPPDNPEFRKFTNAMRTIMSVSKTELKKREAEEKREKQPNAASPGSASSSKPR
jgi:hypothetical protein